ncbi:MAG: hypothetical protein Q9182_001007 [Xanthomendoza sp. 2 TL-2023]
MEHQLIRPHLYVALRLPSGSLTLHETKPNTLISLGKYGSFQSNCLIGRPYHYTYEILDRVDDNTRSGLRIVPPSELYADIQDEEVSTPADLEDEEQVNNDAKESRAQFEVVDQKGEVLLRTNRNIVDDARSQTMTMEEIEMLKAEGKGSGKDLIAKILDSHSALDQKTAFALAKYTLRKTKKYLRRFTALPVDPPLLARWMLTEKDASKTMELREETLALIGSWSNIHFTQAQTAEHLSEPLRIRHGRWLIVDETGGLLVAAAAEKVGILHPPSPQKPAGRPTQPEEPPTDQNNNDSQNPQAIPTKRKSLLALSNTITLIHANSQPNLSLLRYFNFDAANPSPSHSLSQHLKTLSWLQLLHPDDDNACTEPQPAPPEVFQTWKSGKRSNYHRKRRRWERITSIVSETREGGFDGLVVASFMNPTTILHHLVPLLRGAAQVVVYSPSIESLVELADYYSTARRVAYLNDPPAPEAMPTEDFPVNPTLLLAPTVQTIWCRPWQVLPGRTHPVMTGKGGAEGYVFTATRVLPAEGGVEARGVSKKRKGKGSERGLEGRDVKREKVVESMQVEEDMDVAEDMEKGGMRS